MECMGVGKLTMPPFLKEEELSGDELEEFVKKRYDQASNNVVHAEDDKEGNDGRPSLLPTADPPIWRVRCKVGHERRIVFCMIQKYVSLVARGSTLQLVSIFTLEHIKGYIYIEAQKEHDIIEACRGFCDLYTSKISLVSALEVHRLLSSKHKPIIIAEGSWVRMKNGKYKGDIAQVMSFDALRKIAIIKLVPRIDLQALAKKFGGGISLKHAAIPAPRLISSRELEDFRPHIQSRHDPETGELFEILDGLMLKDGYLYKKVSILSLDYFGVQPSSVELMKFEPAKSDERHLSDYISNLFGECKKNTSQTLDDTLDDNRSLFKLHDLVLFGQKDFGVIIGMKGDGFQVLKGGTEEQLIVSVQQREMKKSCIDKMFMAMDSHKKTIRINDTVKVLTGPQKDRQGIVKHMYKGTLFVFSEDVEGDTCFFCVNCELCVLVKVYRPCHFGSKGSGKCSSVSSPIECSERKDDDGGYKRYGQGDRDQLFTVGQTLRIRVGPLKGHLCRVVRIYRSDVTVKLDTQVKHITVNSNNLSVANVKNLGSLRNEAMFVHEEFGSREKLCRSELVDGDMGEPSSRSKWDFQLPSSTRVSWPPLSSWGGFSSNCDGYKASNEEGDGPCRTNITSGNAEEQVNHLTDGWSWTKAEKSTEDGDTEAKDPWGSKVVLDTGSQACHSGNVEQSFQSVDGWGNWTKTERQTEANNQEDPWGSKISLGNGHQRVYSWAEDQSSQPAPDGWTKAQKPSESNDQEVSWTSKMALGHGCKTGLLDNHVGQSSQPADDWSKLEGPTKGNSKGEESKIALSTRCQVGDSGNTEEQQSEPANSWSTWTKARKTADGHHESWKGNTKNEDKRSGWNQPFSNNGQADSWGRGGGGCNSDGNWERQIDGVKSFEVEKDSGSNWKKQATDDWGNWDNANSVKDECNRWRSSNEGEASGWNKAACSDNGQSDNWSRGASTHKESYGKLSSVQISHDARFENSEGAQEFWSNRGKADEGIITEKCETGGWNKAASSSYGHASIWESWSEDSSDIRKSDVKKTFLRSMEGTEHSRLGQVSGTGWDKASMSAEGNWNKAEKTIKSNYKNEGEGDGYSKARTDNYDQEERWIKGKDITERSSAKMEWGRHSCGFNYGRGTRLDTGKDYGSSWGQGRTRNNESHGSGDKPNGWNWSKDSDGQVAHEKGWGFVSGRDKKQDDSWKGSFSDIGSSSGRGRGRNGRGRDSWKGRGSSHDYGDKSSGCPSNIRENGRGRGRGRGRSFGHKQASNWKGGMCSDQEGSSGNVKATAGQETWGQKVSGTWLSWDSASGNRPSGSGGWNSYNQGNSERIDAESSAWDRGAIARPDGSWGQKKCFNVVQGSDVCKTNATSSKVASEEACQGTDGLSHAKGCKSDAVTGWTSASTSSKLEASCENRGWNQVEPDVTRQSDVWTSCNQGNSKQIDAKSCAWVNGAIATHDGGWDQKKCFSEARGSDVWKTDASSSKTASGEACQGTDDLSNSKWFKSDVGTGWTSTTTSSKRELSGEDRGWNQGGI